MVTLRGARRLLPHGGTEDSKDGMGLCLKEHEHDTTDRRKSPEIQNLRRNVFNINSTLTLLPVCISGIFPAHQLQQECFA